jgi:hypothetical protein
VREAADVHAVDEVFKKGTHLERILVLIEVWCCGGLAGVDDEFSRFFAAEDVLFSDP